MGNIKTLVLAIALISALLLFSFLILTFMQPSGVPEKGPVFRIENDAVKADLIKRGLIEEYPNGTRVIHLKGVEELIKKGVYRINPDGVLERKIIGNYEELIGNIKLLISERLTEEKDGAHIFLNLATERIYPCCNFQINSDVKIQGNTIIVEVKNIFVPRIGEAAEGPAKYSKDLGKIEGDYQLILRHKTKEDKYNLKITKDKIEINPIIPTFTVFNQSNILFRVPENVIWIDCEHYDRVGCKENQEYIKICDQFFKEPLISNLQPFEPEEGEYAVKWFNKGHKHFKFFGNISDLRELVESYAIYTSRDISDKERCLLLSIRTWKGDFFYTWDYTWERKTAPLRENRQPTVEKIAMWQNGEEKNIDPESSEYNEIGNILIQTLHKLDLQAVCAFTEERVHQEIKRNDKVVEITFKQANDFPIRQWLEPEGRYNVLKNVKSAIFILEDNLGEGLEGFILVGSEREDRDERCSWKVTEEDMEKLGPCEGIVGYVFSEDHGCIAVSGCKYRHIEDIVPFNSKEECELACGRIMWGCWAIRQKDSNELDKNWIEGINRILAEMKSKEIATKDKIIVGIEAGPIAIECFNKSYLIETSDYIIDGTVEKVDEKADMEKGIYSYVYLTIDGYFKGKPLLVKEKVADMLQINVSVRTPYNFTSYEGKKVRIYLRKWSEGDIRVFCGHYGIEEILEPTKEVPTMTDSPHLNLTPQPGEYFTYRGNKSKILLNDSRLKYCFLELKDICPPNAANVGDLGIVIAGTIKNEYGRDYYICMAAHAFNSEGEQIGGSIDPGPVCGMIAPCVKCGQTGNFELHLKYREDIERIELFVGCVSEIPPP